MASGRNTEDNVLDPSVEESVSRNQPGAEEECNTYKQLFLQSLLPHLDEVPPELYETMKERVKIAVQELRSQGERVDAREDDFVLKKVKVLIISNNFYGSGDQERKGNIKDRVGLMKLFDEKKIVSQLLEDSKGKPLKKEDVETKLKDWSENKDGILNDTDGLIVVIMSHGEQDDNGDYISFVNEEEKLYLQAIYDKFANNRCKALNGKPKIFIIQACRGNEKDYGEATTPIPSSTFIDQSNESLYMDMSEFLIAQASYDGYVSTRTEDGTWFIQSLINVFKAGFEKNKELHAMIIEASREVSKYTSPHETNRFRIYKQVPTFKTTITKPVIFKLLN